MKPPSPAVVMGSVALGVGLAAGTLMLRHPEGLDPSWPLAAALLAPAAFVLGGLHSIAVGLGLERWSRRLLAALVACLWAAAHWAAFFSDQAQCLMTVSFLGIELAEITPSEATCRHSLRLLIGGLDALLAAAAGVAWWQAKHRKIPHIDR